jgi:hypothetical protein
VTTETTITRAERRHRKERTAARVRRIVGEHWVGGRKLVADPKRLGRLVETHMRPCSCPMCQGESYHRQREQRDVERLEIEAAMSMERENG